MDDIISKIIDILVSCGIDYGDSINKFIAFLIIFFYILFSFFKIFLSWFFVSLVCDFIFSLKERFEKKPDL